jgi:UDP-N-acetyl-D-glucosamine dehydrogenase
VDPYYLSWKAREFDFYTKFIELAAEVNQSMPFHVVGLVADAVNRDGRALDGANVLVLGVSFKRDIDDARNSPAERVIELLLARRAQVTYHDPYVPRFHVGNSVFHREQIELTQVPLSVETVRAADVVVIVTAHRALDYTMVLANARRIVDTSGVTAGLPQNEKIVRLGAPTRSHSTSAGAHGE